MMLKGRIGMPALLATIESSFNIKGNAYRLIVRINYEKEWIFIRFISTHKEYDPIDASTC